MTAPRPDLAQEVCLLHFPAEVVVGITGLALQIGIAAAHVADGSRVQGAASPQFDRISEGIVFCAGDGRAAAVGGDGRADASDGAVELVVDGLGGVAEIVGDADRVAVGVVVVGRGPAGGIEALLQAAVLLGAVVDEGLRAAIGVDDVSGFAIEVKPADDGVAFLVERGDDVVVGVVFHRQDRTGIQPSMATRRSSARVMTISRTPQSSFVGLRN